MKFLVFSDLHHNRDLFLSGTAEDVRAFQRRAVEQECDFIIHCGDFSFGDPTDLPLIREYNAFSVPSYHTLGNHDADRTPFPQMLEHLGLENNYYYFDVKGYRIIVLDACYHFDGEQYYHFTSENDPAPKPQEPFESEIVPPEELVWLEETIALAEGPCIVLSHHSFEREYGGVKNYDSVRKIINEANRRKPHSVLLCLNGHYHIDHLRLLDNVLYFDVNSVKYYWVGGKGHDFYPEELCRGFSRQRHTLTYNDPLCAVVTIEGTHIKIEGAESSLLLGVTKEMTGLPNLDDMIRLVTARIQSLDITL